MSSDDPLSFLQSLEPFVLSEPDKEATLALGVLAEASETWSYESEDIVRFPDEGANGPLWVMSGCLAVFQEGCPVRYFGPRERVPDDSGLWVRGQTAGQFLRISDESWDQWRKSYPQACSQWGFPEPSELPDTLRRTPMTLEPGEVIRATFRKSRLSLVPRLGLPLILFLAFLSFGIGLQLRLGEVLAGGILWTIPGIGLGISLVLGGIALWEWMASVLVITDRAVLLRQIDVWHYRSDYEKLALGRIREAVVRKSGLIDAILRLAQLEIEGDSPKGRLVFAGLSQGSGFLEALRESQKQVQPGSLERKQIREALVARQGQARAPVLERPGKSLVRSKGLKRRHWRRETSDGVWFRRHPWTIWRKTFWWIAIAVLLVTFVVILALRFPEWMKIWFALGAVLVAVPSGKVAWQIWDWANDRFHIEGNRVILVHRRPLWLGEVRQEGTLDRVEQVGVRKENLAALLLDFGTVTVYLGSSSPLVFDWAHHPEWVQNEIFSRRTLAVQEQNRRAQIQRLDEMADVLGTWKEAEKAGYFEERKNHD